MIDCCFPHWVTWQKSFSPVFEKLSVLKASQSCEDCISIADNPLSARQLSDGANCLASFWDRLCNKSEVIQTTLYVLDLAF